MMDLESLIRDERAGLTGRLSSALGGDRHAAEDVCQEAFTRAWQRLPRDLDARSQRAWLRRTAANLAIDELRRRARRPTTAIDGETATIGEASEPDAAREALGRLAAHERFVLLLHFDAGFAHAEIGRVLDISEEAARKRVARARDAFLRAYRAARSNPTPLVLVLAREEPATPYTRWLEAAGAQVRHTSDPTLREVALADGLVVTGGQRDLHSSLYGEPPRVVRGTPDLAQDRADLGVIKAALELDLPIVGICRGHQLLNIACGGSLYQDILADGATGERHDEGSHRLRTRLATATRDLLGHSATVHSEHHQAVKQLGRRLRVAASSPDGVIEVIEHSDQRFAMGLQWHPEATDGRDGERIAEALLEAAVARAA